MHWQQILRIIEERPRGEFPTLDCERQFSTRFNKNPQRITYDKLMRRNFSIPEDGSLLGYFDDVHGTCGDDALAYYRPFHGPRNDWGIHILEAGVDYLATRIGNLAERDNINLSRLDVEYLAKHKLLLHELGHHAVEISHSLLEINPDHPIRDSYRRYRRAKQNEQMLHENEEAVCNWNVKKKKRHFKIRAQNYYDVTRDFMLNYQPDGYKHFEKIAPRNYLKNIMVPDPRLPQETKSSLKKQFTIHSRLSMVKPFTKKKEEKAFQVPIYLIRTGKH